MSLFLQRFEIVALQGATDRGDDRVCYRRFLHLQVPGNELL